MGQVFEFNWVLKLRPEQGLDESRLSEGASLSFRKEGLRIYPMGIPIELFNTEWDAAASVAVMRTLWEDGRTGGNYRVLRVYRADERKARGMKLHPLHERAGKQKEN